MSSKTLELWQILGSVENLLVSGQASLRYLTLVDLEDMLPCDPAPSVSPVSQERCEQGLKTKIIKKRGDSKRNSGQVDVEVEGRKAMNRLDSVAVYMCDFADICAAFREAEKEKEKLAAKGGGDHLGQPPESTAGGHT